MKTAQPTAPRMTVAQQQLATDNLEIAYWVLNNRFSSYRSAPVVWSDLESAAMRGLCDATLRYDLNRGAFSTFATATIWGVCSRVVRRLNETPDRIRNPVRDADRLDRVPLSNLMIDRRESPRESAERSEICAAVLAAVERFPARDQIILRHRFGLGGCAELDWGGISALTGLSKIAARQRFVRLREQFLFVFRDVRTPPMRRLA